MQTELEIARQTLDHLADSYWAKDADSEDIGWRDVTDEHGDIVVRLADIIELATGERPADTGWRNIPIAAKAKNVVAVAIRERLEKVRDILAQLEQDGNRELIVRINDELAVVREIVEQGGVA